MMNPTDDELIQQLNENAKKIEQIHLLDDLERNETLSNMTWIMNASKKVDLTLLERYERNLLISQGAYALLALFCTCLVLTGSIGNLMVIISVVRQSSMRTARNFFIVNLAVSDLLLCVITSPFTFNENVSQYWTLGDVACRCLSALKAVSVYVSALSITSIALDRYFLIVFPTKQIISKSGACIIICCIWTFSILVASPLYIYRKATYHSIGLTSINVDYISFCVEAWPIPDGRFYYSVASMMIQYIVPIITVVAAYTVIYFKLKRRQAISTAAQRSTKTTSLLISITVIFVLCWMPLNLYNVIVDFMDPEIKSERNTILYSVCHLVAMSSACANPILYGWFNENFRKEFNDMCCFAKCAEMSSGQQEATNLPQSEQPIYLKDRPLMKLSENIKNGKSDNTYLDTKVSPSINSHERRMSQSGSSIMNTG